MGVTGYLHNLGTTMWTKPLPGGRPWGTDRLSTGLRRCEGSPSTGPAESDTPGDLR